VTSLFPLFVLFLVGSYVVAVPGEGLPAPLGPKIEVALVYAPLFSFVAAALLYALGRCCCTGDGKPHVQPHFFPSVFEREIQAIRFRRKSAGFAEKEEQWLCSLALPGGGIRQANFCIGVILALVAEQEDGRALWRHVDLLPAVSGGGYAATSLVSHLLGSAATSPLPAGYDAKARHAAAQSAILLSRHANWPMERNWPSCLDCVLRLLAPCGLAGLVSLVILASMGLLAFLAPFVLLWAINVMLLPVSLVFAMDLPQQLGHSECESSVWFLFERRVVLSFAAVLVGLRIATFYFSRRATKFQAAVNRVVRGVHEIDDADFHHLRMCHGRAVVGAHFFGSIFGVCAMAWLFACAYAAAGFNCGTFARSNLQTLDLALLGSVALLLHVCQSQQNPGHINIIPVVLLILGGALMYALACVHFDAFLLVTTPFCESKCDARALKNVAGRFFARKHFYVAIAVWGLHPILYNVWSFMLPRWYQFKLTRYLHQRNSQLSLKELHDEYSDPNVMAPYLLLSCAVHHIWRWPRLEEPRKSLEKMFSSTFIFSAFFVGDDSVGFVPTTAHPHCRFMLAGAAAVSGAATSNHIVKTTTPFHHVLTFFSGLLFGYWMQLEPDSPEQQRPTAILMSLAGALLHFAVAASMLFAYEHCHHSDLEGPRLWSCDTEGQRFALLGLVAFILELCLVPVFMTWLRPLWRMAFFGKWFSEWMQIQDFSFPPGASRFSPLPRHVYLSDGGHISNLGLLEPLRRRSRVIIVPHCGFTNTHLASNLVSSIQRAREDDSISACFVPVEWERSRGFRRINGSIEAYLTDFSTDMNKNYVLVGVEYKDFGESAANESLSLLKNTWGLVVLFTNRPVGQSKCDSWGVAAPSPKFWAQLDESLDQLPSLLREQRKDDTATTAFIAGRDRRKAMYDRSGNCFSCCHRLPSRVACNFGTFPNHPTVFQCLSPEVAQDYQALGFAVANMHTDLLKALMDQLKRRHNGSTLPPWRRDESA